MKEVGSNGEFDLRFPLPDPYLGAEVRVRRCRPIHALQSAKVLVAVGHDVG
jgi:hypothetical protein